MREIHKQNALLSIQFATHIAPTHSSAENDAQPYEIDRIWSKSLSRTIREPQKRVTFRHPNCLAGESSNLDQGFTVKRGDNKKDRTGNFLINPNFALFFLGDVALFLFGFRVLVAIFGHASLEFGARRA